MNKISITLLTIPIGAILYILSFLVKYIHYTEIEKRMLTLKTRLIMKVCTFVFLSFFTIYGIVGFYITNPKNLVSYISLISAIILLILTIIIAAIDGYNAGKILFYLDHDVEYQVVNRFNAKFFCIKNSKTNKTTFKETEFIFKQNLQLKKV